MLADVGPDADGAQLHLVLCRELEVAHVGLGDVLGRRARHVVTIHEKRHLSRTSRFPEAFSCAVPRAR
jgi:hypothetical protein